MPFRSETEPLREQIRRADEQASELTEEHAALEAQLAAQKAESGGARRKLVTLVAVLVVMATSFVGFVAGDLAADKVAAQARLRREQRHGEQSDRAVGAARACAETRSVTLSALGFCEQQQDSARRQLQTVPAPTGGAR